ERWPQQRVTASAHGWGHQDGREAQTLGLTGAQTTQLLVEPPWRPAVLWDRVTLTCQGSGNTGVTTWYKDGQRWRQERHNRLTVPEKGNYTCERPGTGLSPPVRVLDAPLVLQVPAQALLEGDTMTLHCRRWRDNPVSSVSFYHEEKKLQELRNGTELSLSPLQLQHSGRYSCRGWVKSTVSRGWEKWESVTVTVHELFMALVLEVHSEPTNGSPLTLSCLSNPSPLRPRAPLLHLFYWDGQVLGGPQGSPQLLVPAMGVSHSGNYSCQVHSKGGTVQKSSTRLRVTVCRTGHLSISWYPGGLRGTAWPWSHLELHHTGDNGSGHCQCGDSTAESLPLNVTVLCDVPVANATITLSPLSHLVRSGDTVTLRCSVQVGSAPVTFTWLHNGQEVAQGPLLELRAVDVGHSGTYQCMVTNQQDGHQALSSELALEVTTQDQGTAVSAGVGGSLLFLVLLLDVLGGWHWWHHPGAPQGPRPLQRQGRCCTARSCETRRQGVTNAELPGPHGQQQDSSDIYKNML
ncbi:Fc receptor-like protein 3, partial [Ammospiza nelsoni]|uniref:Fc receptor-like protein 3 n=1 Tax=Ammospiza nelsoni TaxID=2857394 RepID=UPI00286B932A